jgi:hypothetical protein
MINFTIIDWNIEEMTGYKPKTSFYRDFSIADKFGKSAILDTYKGIERNLKSLHYTYITELSMALNWKIWEHYEKNDAIARVYNDLWFKICNYIRKNFNEEELRYYYRVTD